MARFACNGVEKRGVALRENLALVLRDFFCIGMKRSARRIGPCGGIDKELANARNILIAGPPAGT